MNQNWKISQYCVNPQKYDLSNYQDACGSYTDGDVSVMALCAGSSAGMHSHIGASCIAEFSAGYFAEHFDSLYDAEFNAVCAELTNYHQAMISHLADVAFERKNVQILVNRTIQLKELNKFASTVQILAVKEDKAIYFKVGNGSAAVASGDTLMTLSDSVLQNPEVVITTPNPIYVLINCDFKTFTISPSCYALSLATDGAEFENGLFFEHHTTPFYQQLIEDVCNPENDSEEELKKAIVSLLNDNVNTAKDNIGISVMYRELPEEPESAEEDTDMDTIPLVDIEDEMMDEIPEESVEEELTEEATEEEAVEELAEKETEEEAVEEFTEEVTEEETVEEFTEKVTEEAVVEEFTEEATEEEAVEELTEEEAGEEFTEEVTEEEAVEEITEEATEEEAVEEFAEEATEEEAVEELTEEATEEEAVEEFTEEATEEEAVEELTEEVTEEAVVEELTEEVTEEETVEEFTEEVTEEETAENDFETSFFDEEPEEKSGKSASAEKAKFSIKTNKMKASVGTKQSSDKKGSKKTAKLFKFFNISITKK